MGRYRGVETLSPEGTCSDLHAPELPCEWGGDTRGGAEEQLAEVTDQVQGKGIGPSSCQDKDTSGSLTQRELCHPRSPRAEVGPALQEDAGPALCLLHCPQHTSPASRPPMATPTVTITSAFQQQEGGTRPNVEATYISFSPFH